MNEAEFESQLKKLKQEFAGNLVARLRDINEYQSALRLATKGESSEYLDKLQRAAHSLAGSGASFGFSVTSDVAAILDSRLQELQRHKGDLSTGDIAEIDSLIDNTVRQTRAELKNYHDRN